MRNFFEHQAAAQRRTTVLVSCMLLSVLVMAGCAFGVLCLVRGFLLLRFPVHTPVPAALSLGRLWLWSCSVTVGLVAAAALLRILSLRQGGSSIAELLSARLVSGQPADALDRRLLNVVTEMALAAGTPVPQVYVLDREPGINALAAGWQLGDAIICVTRGCLEKLTRAELQGVVAHEFSHILHGDARLNLRLMGVVYGMVSVQMLGRVLMSTFEPARGRESGRSLAVIGAMIVAVGAIGGFLGKLVKAAVSRQREFLADASAVQFTRNPDGIAGALKKIGGYSHGGRVANLQATEASHFFFGDIGQGESWAWLSTHPSLAERIRRIQPGFDGELVVPHDGLAEVADLEPLTTAFGPWSARDPARVSPLQASEVLPLVGSPGARPVSEPPSGQGTPLDPQLVAATQSAFSACGLVFALLVSDDHAVQRRQATAILELAGPALLREAQRMHQGVQRLPRAERLTLAILSAPALRTHCADQRKALQRTVAALIEADGATSVFEHVLGYVLSDLWTRRRRVAAGHAGLSALLAEARLVLSALAHLGASSGDSAQHAFAHALGRLPGVTLSLLPQSPRLLAGLAEALDRLRQLRPTARAALIEACAHAVLADHRVTDDELTVLRAVCVALEAPLPPLAEPAQPLSPLRVLDRHSAAE